MLIDENGDLVKVKFDKFVTIEISTSSNDGYQVAVQVFNIDGSLLETLITKNRIMFLEYMHFLADKYYESEKF